MPCNRRLAFHATRCLAATLLLAGLAADGSSQARTGSAGGVKWSVPKAWTDQPGSSMRVATYKVPAAKAAEPGEVTVFFFGPGQGGSIDANVERWSRQFEGTPKPARTQRRLNGLPLTLVELAGTYLAPGGPMMQSQGTKPGYRLVAAIVEAPEGLIFFKLTGPAASVGAAQADFDSLLASLAKS